MRHAIALGRALLLVGCVADLSHAQTAAPLILESPDQRIRVRITVADRLSYAIDVDDRAITGACTLSMRIDQQVLGAAPRLLKSTARRHDGVVEPPVRQKAARLRDHYNEVRLDFDGQYAVVFRAYDEGVAYRFETSLAEADVTVVAEDATFAFAADFPVYYPEEQSFFSHNERHYLPRALSDLAAKNIASLPAVVDARDVKVAIAESDVEHYPGLWLRGTGGRALAATFPPYALDETLTRDRDLRVTTAADYIARTSGTRTYPWRILGIAHDDGAISLIARAASGSLRDGLSLLDQAIAFGAGEVRADPVRSMLGVVDREFVYRIADALAAGDGSALLAQADAIGARGLSAGDALAELAGLVHRIAVAQAVPQAAEGFDDGERVAGYAARFSPEAVQLLWQIAAQGRADLAIAPDEAMGLSMTLLRMLAFEPGTGAPPTIDRPPSRDASAPAMRGEAPAAEKAQSSAPRTARSPSAPPAAQAAAAPASTPPKAVLPTEPGDWPAFVASLGLTGMARELAAQTEMRRLEGSALTLALPAAHRHLTGKTYADRLRAALEQATGRKLLLAFEVGEQTDGSLASRTAREREEAKARTEATFRDEPFVRDVVTRFDATVRSDTIKPR